MRKLFLLILLLAGCSSEGLMTGDLVFVAAPGETGTGSISDAIVASTSKDSLNIIHVGIISVDGGHVSVLDATGERGVAIRSLDEFYEDFRLFNLRCYQRKILILSLLLSHFSFIAFHSY